MTEERNMQRDIREGETLKTLWCAQKICMLLSGPNKSSQSERDNPLLNHCARYCWWYSPKFAAALLRFFIFTLKAVRASSLL